MRATCRVLRRDEIRISYWRNRGCPRARGAERVYSLWLDPSLCAIVRNSAMDCDTSIRGLRPETEVAHGLDISRNSCGSRVRLRLANNRRTSSSAGNDFSTSHQGNYRAAAFWNLGGGDCGTSRPEKGRSDGAQSPRVLRDRLHFSSGHRLRGYQHYAGWS